MKFAVLALIVGLCLMSINADRISPIAKDLSVDYVEIEGQTFWKPMYWTFKKVLRTAKYLHCSIGVVLQMERATERYLAKLHSCSAEFTDQVKNAVLALQQVVDIAQTICHINTEICKYPDPSEVMLVESEDNQEPEELFTAWSCYWKLLKQFDNLEHEIVVAMKLILALPEDASLTGECMKNATQDLTTTYGTFNDCIKNCANQNSTITLMS